MSQHFSEMNIGTAAVDEFARLPRLPDLFERRATRMAQLAQGHTMAGFLRLLETLFRVQALACGTGGVVLPPPPDAILRAAEHGMPVLSADSWVPTVTYGETLRFIAANIGREGLPPQTAGVLANLERAGAEHFDRLASMYLAHAVTPPWQGEMLFAAAALQVEFARVASQLDAAMLRPLDATGLCPVCGSAPVAGVVVADEAHGRRYLTCGLCSTSWHHVRVSCISCGEESGVAYYSVNGGLGYAKAETCDNCKTYSKLFYQEKEMAVEPLCDDIATMQLDMLVSNAGWKRHAPNPLVLVL